MQSNNVSKIDYNSFSLPKLSRIISTLLTFPICQQIKQIIKIPLKALIIHKSLKCLIVKIISTVLYTRVALQMEVMNYFNRYIFQLSELSISDLFRQKLIRYLRFQTKGWARLERSKTYQTGNSQASTTFSYLKWKQAEQTHFHQFLVRRNTKTITNLSQLHIQQYKFLEGSRNFIQNKTDHKYSWLFGNHDDRYFQELVKLKACGLLNAGGGYLFIEVNKWVIEDGSTIQQRCDEIRKNIRWYIYPCSFQIDPTYFSSPNLQTAYIRVKILPKNVDLAYYVVKKFDDPQKSRPKVCLDKFVLLDFKNQGSLYDFVEYSNTQELYTYLINNFYYLKKNKSTYPIKSSRQKIQCLSSQLPTLSENQFKIRNVDQFIQIRSQQPKVFPNNYLFILTNLDILVQNVSRALTRMKCKFHFMKPHMFYDRNYFKSIWFLGVTEVEEQEKMLQIARGVADMKSNGGTNNKYTIMKCTKVIIVKKISQDYVLIEDYIKIFRQKYNKNVNHTKKKKKHKGNISYDYTFNFETIEESIFFSYLLLQNYEKKMKFQAESWM